MWEVIVLVRVLYMWILQSIQIARHGLLMCCSFFLFCFVFFFVLSTVFDIIRL